MPKDEEVEMTEIDLEYAAKCLLKNVGNLGLKDDEIYIFKWRGDSYFGGVQKIKDEIVLISKTTHMLSEKFADAIIRINPNIVQLVTDDTIDFVGRSHVLRRVENRLTFMTPEQTRYMIENPINVIEYRPNA